MQIFSQINNWNDWLPKLLSMNLSVYELINRRSTGMNLKRTFIKCFFLLRWSSYPAVLSHLIGSGIYSSNNKRLLTGNLVVVVLSMCDPCNMYYCVCSPQCCCSAGVVYFQLVGMCPHLFCWWMNCVFKFCLACDSCMSWKNTRCLSSAARTYGNTWRI